MDAKLVERNEELVEAIKVVWKSVGSHARKAGEQFLELTKLAELTNMLSDKDKAGADHHKAEAAEAESGAC